MAQAEPPRFEQLFQLTLGQGLDRQLFFKKGFGVKNRQGFIYKWQSTAQFVFTQVGKKQTGFLGPGLDDTVDPAETIVSSLFK